MTKRELFNALVTIVEGTEVENAAELVEGLQHEIELLDNRKSYKSDKPTKAQKERMEQAEKVAAVLGDEGMTATDVIAAVNDENIRSTQKVSALMKVLINDGRAVKVKDGKKVFFRLPTEDEVAEIEGE
jgi:sulfur carrier protein ThiS